MPTMAERMSVVETEIKHIKEKTDDTHGDVKTLLTWQAEERGARRQRAAFVAAIAVVVPLVASVALKVVFG